MGYDAIKNLSWILRKVFNYNKLFIPIIVLSNIFSGLVPSWSILITQEILNSLQMNKELKYILIYVCLYLFLDLFEMLHTNLLNYYKTKFSLNFNLMFNKLVLEKSSKLRLADFENSETYDFITRAKNECDGKLLAYLEQYSLLLKNFTTVISLLAILYNFNKIIILIICIAPIFKFFFNVKINKESFEIIQNRTNDSRKAWYYQYILTYGDFFKEIKTYNLFSYFINKYTEYNKQFNIQDLRLMRKGLYFISIISILELLIDGSIFIFIILQGLYGYILIGNVMSYIRSVANCKEKISEILQLVSDIGKNSLFIDQLKQFLNLKELNEEHLVTISEIKDIRVENLSYKYRNNIEYILRNINFQIKNNENIAIVGKNGSGKTTLVKLLMGFYDDYEGNIFINNIELRNINKKSLLSLIGSVFQDFIKYESTLKENIAYGNLDVYDDEQIIRKTIDAFELSDLVNKNNNFIDFQIGHWFDNGHQISLGEWQKVALSRAFVKDADLYILDEPNASLDAISEYNILKNYNKLFKNKITIIISHKFLRVLDNINNIILLDKGEIRGFGNHSELLNNPIYKELYNLQFSNN